MAALLSLAKTGLMGTVRVLACLGVFATGLSFVDVAFFTIDR